MCGMLGFLPMIEWFEVLLHLTLLQAGEAILYLGSTLEQCSGRPKRPCGRKSFGSTASFLGHVFLGCEFLWLLCTFLHDPNPPIASYFILF
jgi:hypothetical protein